MQNANVEVEYLSCTCCGKGVRDNAAENVSFGEQPYPHDTGIGMCRECGGDDRVKATSKKPLSEKAVRKRIGWASETFYDARIDVVAKRLSGAHAEKFKAMSYVQKIAIVQGLVEKGVIV